MTNFLSLVKVQFFSLLSANKLSKSKAKKTAGFGGIALMLLIIGGAMVFFGYTYSKIFAMTLSPVGEIDKLIPLMIAIASLIAFMFSFYAVGSTLFGFKDYDMLMSMPLKPREIVLSKFCVLYVSELFFSLTIVIPSLFVYFSQSAFDIIKVVSTVVMCFFAPLLPLAISCVVGVLVYYISSRFRKKNIIQIILLFLVMIGVMGFSFISGFSSEDPAQMQDTLGVLSKVYFIFPWALKAFTETIWLLTFVVANILPIILVIAFICLFYKKLNTIFTAKRTLKNFKLKEYKTIGIRKTLFNKEMKRVFSSPIYALNCLLGSIMALITSIAYAILFNVLSKNFGSEISELFSMFNGIIPALFCFMFLLAPTTSCAISMEGRAFWVIKTAPVSYKQVLNSKLAVNAVFSTAVAFVCSLIIGISARFGSLGTGLLVFCALGISSFGGVFGLLMNLRFPKLDWTNENQPVKQSLPVFLCVLVAMFSSAIIIVMFIYVNLSTNALLAIYASFFVLLTVGLYIVLYKFGDKMFNKLN